MKLIWSFLLLAVPMSSFAQSQSQSCPDKVERRGSIQVQQSASGDNKSCYISVHNFKEGGLVYRDYLVSSDGNFMVFNSFGNGPDNVDTGAREFYFFPRPVAQIVFNWNDDARRLEVTNANGSVLSFDYEDAQITAINTAQVKVASEVVKANRGGVEISNFKGLLMDGGFAIGKAPTSSSSSLSTFTDETGTTCKIKNGDLFKYTSDGDSSFRYTDKSLMAFLKTKCPKLKTPVVN